MSEQKCLACEHVNPSGAKFCVECGSKLNLKLCSKCEAVNDVKAEHCYKCNAPFPKSGDPALAPKPAAEPAAKARRMPRTAVALGVAGVLALGGALAFAFIVVRPQAQVRGPVVVKQLEPALVTPAALPVAVEKVIVEKVEKPKPVAPLAAPKPKPVPERPQYSAAPRPVPVTHTRAATAAPASVARTVEAEPAAVALPERPSTNPPVTHTKRAHPPTETKSESTK